MENKATEVSFETILRRLESWNERLDRELEHNVVAKLPKGSLDNLQSSIAKLDARLVKQAQERIDSELSIAAPRQSDLNKPNVFQIATMFRGRLLRA